MLTTRLQRHIGLGLIITAAIAGCNEPQEEISLAPEPPDYYKSLPPGERALVKLTDPSQFPDVTLIRSPTNRGFSAGNNLGAAGAEEAHLLFLNSDTVVPPGTVRALLEFMDSRPGCVAVGPRLISPDGTLQWSCRTFPGPLNTLLEGLWLDRLFPRSRFFGRPRMTWFDHARSATVDYVSGAAMLVSRQAFEAAGGWPEEYFFYAEDADLCYLMRRAGGEVCFFGGVEVVHVGGASASQASAQTILQAHRSLLLFAMRTGGPAQLLLQRLATILTTIPRLIGAILILPFAMVRGRASPACSRIATYARVLRASLSRLP